MANLTTHPQQLHISHHHLNSIGPAFIHHVHIHIPSWNSRSMGGCWWRSNGCDGRCPVPWFPTNAGYWNWATWIMLSCGHCISTGCNTRAHSTTIKTYKQSHRRWYLCSLHDEPNQYIISRETATIFSFCRYSRRLCSLPRRSCLAKSTRYYDAEPPWTGTYPEDNFIRGAWECCASRKGDGDCHQKAPPNKAKDFRGGRLSEYMMCQTSVLLWRTNKWDLVDQVCLRSVYRVYVNTSKAMLDVSHWNEVSQPGITPGYEVLIRVF